MNNGPVIKENIDFKLDIDNYKEYLSSKITILKNVNQNNILVTSTRDACETFRLGLIKDENLYMKLDKKM